MDDLRSAEAQRLTDKLRDIQALTDSALSALGPQAVLDVLVDRVRRVLQADTAAVLLLDDSAAFLIATAASGLEEEVNQGVRVPVGKGYAGRIAAERRPIVLTEVDHFKVVNPLLVDKGIRSLMGAPLISHQKVLGVLHVGTLTPREFTSEDVELLQLAADRAASAVEALASRLDRAAAAALQRSLLPSALPALPHVQMAARFVPGRGNVGGDWYDVFCLPSGQVCAVIGDVAGSGLKAAAVMGRMRSALRAYALETPDPAEILTRLERKMRHFEPDAMATVLCAVFSHELDRVQISNAGHLPPLMALPGQSAGVVQVTADPVIGASDYDRRQVSVELPPDALLCFYTDGLVERRDVPIDDGIARLCKAVRHSDPESCCAAAMTAMADVRPPGDDIALLVFLLSAGASRPAEVPPDSAAGAGAGGAAGAGAVGVEGASVRWSGRRAVVTLPAEIDVTTAARVYQLLAAVAAQRPDVLVADLTSTTFCDSAGLSALTRVRQTVLAYNGELRVALGTSPVGRIFELSGLGLVIPTFADAEQALRR